MQPPQPTDEETDPDVLISFSPISLSLSLSLSLPLPLITLKNPQKLEAQKWEVISSTYWLSLICLRVSVCFDEKSCLSCRISKEKSIPILINA